MKEYFYICNTMQNNININIDIVNNYVYNILKKGGYYMATTNINVRVDSELKQSAENLFNDLGLNMTSAITMFLKSAVSHDGIPFEVKRTTPNAETKAALAEFEEMKNNPSKYKRYNSFDEVLDEVFDDA